MVDISGNGWQTCVMYVACVIVYIQKVEDFLKTILALWKNPSLD